MQIKKGDCLVKSKPFAYVLSSKHRDSYCDYCVKSGQLLKCSGCQYVYYCDHSCQKKSWSIHKFECANLRKIFPRVLPDAARLLSRIIVKLRNGGAEEKEYYAKNSFRKFKDLMSHYTDLKNDHKRVEHFVSLCKVLEDFMGSSELPNSSEIMGIYGKMCINSYSITDSETTSIGVGIYLAPSIIDHSCKPNAVAVFEGTTILIRAVEDIPRLDWSKIHVSYINVLKTTNCRRNELQKIYYFICDCKKCKEPEIYATAAICSYCKDLCNVEEESCSNCGKEISHSFKEKFNEVTKFTARHLETMNVVPYLDISRTCLNKQKGLFHTLNIQHIKTLESGFYASLNLGYYEDAYTFGAQLLKGYLYYYGEIDPQTGILYLSLGKIQLYLNRLKEALELLLKAEKILNITHGEEHSLVKNTLLPLLYQAMLESNQ